MMLDRGIHLAYFDPATGHVPNPGMGISAYVFSDHMHYAWNPNAWRETEVTAPNNPVTRDTLNRMLDLPYVDNLYFRADWDRVQSAPGKLDLPPEWDWMMEAVESRGKRWSFRIMNSSRHSVNASSVPDFLRDELEFGSYRNEYRFGPERKFYPLYTPEYHARWRELLELFASAYDSHPLLEYVDISGYGIWGEGHHYGFHDDADTSVYNRHADNAEDAIGTIIGDHLQAFTQTPVAMTLHYLDYEAGVRALKNPRVWLRRDSFQPFASVTEYSATAFAVPGQAVIWETLVPSDTSMRAPLFTLKRTVQRYLDFNAHYAAVGFNPWEVIQAHDWQVEIYEHLAARLGYRLRPAVTWRRLLDDDSQELVIALANDGTANVPGTVTLEARFPSGASASVELPTGSPVVGDRSLYTLPIPKADWDAQSDRDVELRIAARIGGKVSPLRWAVRQHLQDPFVARMPLRMPAPGDPFGTQHGTYEPTL